MESPKDAAELYPGGGSAWFGVADGHWGPGATAVAAAEDEAAEEGGAAEEDDAAEGEAWEVAVVWVGPLSSVLAAIAAAPASIHRLRAAASSAARAASSRARAAASCCGWPGGKDSPAATAEATWAGDVAKEGAYGATAGPAGVGALGPAWGG